jgi:hypothetical protein
LSGSAFCASSLRRMPSFRYFSRSSESSRFSHDSDHKHAAAALFASADSGSFAMASLNSATAPARSRSISFGSASFSLNPFNARRHSAKPRQ